ncbi:hypothetical protein KKG65_00790 [Patescibacteria group bacterium]|nr:hypothetical protein [Patescibacteria group bacterium]
MTKSQIERARKIIKNKPTLIWSTKNHNNLSAQSITEAVLNYADWSEFQKLKHIFGLKQLKKIFNQLTKQKRVNLRPSTINYFKLYFNRYAS